MFLFFSLVGISAASRILLLRWWLAEAAAVFEHCKFHLRTTYQLWPFLESIRKLLADRNEFDGSDELLFVEIASLVLTCQGIDLHQGGHGES